MRIDIITVLPEMIEGFFNCSIMKRAQNKGLAEIHIHNLRDYTEDKYRRVDDYPFGGFAGMVMKIEPIERCIDALKAERDYDEVIFTTPDGEQFNQPMANTLSLAQNLIILCGHFKGIDYRIREHLITKEISIGDYVLTGGELAAASFNTDMLSISSGFTIEMSVTSTLSTNMSGLDSPFGEPMLPRILMVGAPPISPELVVMVSPGTEPCKARPISVIGRLSIVLFTSTEATAPVKFTFFCEPYPTTTTSSKSSVSSFNITFSIGVALTSWVLYPTKET